MSGSSLKPPEHPEVSHDAASGLRRAPRSRRDRPADRRRAQPRRPALDAPDRRARAHLAHGGAHARSEPGPARGHHRVRRAGGPEVPRPARFGPRRGQDRPVSTVPAPKPLRLIDDAGHAVDHAEAGGFALPSPAALLGLYRQMVVARRFDVQVTALTRQGRLATYPSALGQEACEIAAVASLARGDWLFPTYRDSIALLTR